MIRNICYSYMKRICWGFFVVFLKTNLSAKVTGCLHSSLNVTKSEVVRLMIIHNCCTTENIYDKNVFLA